MTDDLDAPGMKRYERRDGSEAFYWVAAQVTRQATDYPVKTVRLHYATPEARALRCRTLTGQLLKWLAEKGRSGPPAFTGTMASLIKCYQIDPDSPYRGVASNTQAGYDHDLGTLIKNVGGVSIGPLNRADFARWYTKFKAPIDGGPERLRRAHGLMTMVRIVLKFGAGMRYADCRDALDIISDMRFEQPAAREVAMTFEQAEAIVAKALEMGLRSIALGQALQFELGLRQTDVAGKWEPARDPAGIVSYHKRWTAGVTWSDIDGGGTLVKRTSKTGALGSWHLASAPLVMRALAAFPAEERVGPMIVSEATGLPYLPGRYSRTWRKVAEAAGVPGSIWNRDSRAGAVTEGFDAGAEAKDLQRFATHANFATTSRYARNSTAGTNRVATLRIAKREKIK